MEIDRRMDPRDYNVIIEMIPNGRYVKVSAVDTRTGVEVSIVGDPRRGEAALQQAAINKLRYVMEKRGMADDGDPR
jgi:hypothetical protein